MAQSAAARFSIGRVIADSFGIYARNFISFSVLALLIGLIDLLITIFYLAPNQVGGPGEFRLVGFDAVLMISLMLLTHTLTQATIVFGTFQDLRGHKAGIGTCIAHGLSSIIPVIVGSIILVIGVGLASLLLLIPGLIVMTMWWVYIPTIVVERKSIAAGFVRSQELTSGHRWPIFGLIIIVMVLSALVTYVTRTISFTVISNSTSMDALSVVFVVDYLGSSLAAAFGAVVVAVGYYYLRAEKEGIDADEIASVFD
jgi:hypothetical protein